METGNTDKKPPLYNQNYYSRSSLDCYCGTFPVIWGLVVMDCGALTKLWSDEELWLLLASMCMGVSYYILFVSGMILLTLSIGTVFGRVIFNVAPQRYCDGV